MPDTRQRRLTDIVQILALQFPVASPPTQAFRLLMWETIGYLIDDERRAALFEAFDRDIGLEPRAILGAAPEALMALARPGGMRPQVRVERWRASARLVVETCDGDLDATLRALPLAKARALLKRFASIGDPGADKILLFADIAARPCLDSNGLRALARLGYFTEQKNYDASYRAAVAVLAEQGAPDRDWLMAAYLGLRELGQALCKRAAPHCLACPLDPLCLHRTVSAL